MEWKGSGDGVAEGVVVENRTVEPKHIEVDCQTSNSTVFSEAVRLAPGEATSYSELPDRMIEVNVRAANGPKGRSMFGSDTVSGAIVVQVTDDDVTFETTTGPYDPHTRDYTPSDSGDGSNDGRATSDVEAAGHDGEAGHDANDGGSKSTTAKEQSAASATRQERRNQPTTTADRGGHGGSSPTESSGSSAQSTSQSTGETPARSVPESSRGERDANTTGGTVGRGTNEHVGEPGQQPSPTGTSPSEDGEPDRDTPQWSGIDEYLTDSEEAKKVLTGDTRLFAVTDRRILDVTQSTNASGASVEEVETTLFSYVTGVDVSITGPTTNVDLVQWVLGASIAIVGLLIAIASLILDAGDVTAVGILVGLIVLGVGVWIYYSASERVPGGIRITFTHTGGSRGSGDSYLLPEGQGNTAREVVRQLGTAHAPDPEPE